MELLNIFSMFNLIKKDKDNEEKIINYLKMVKANSEFVNYILNNGKDETMLMLAIYNLKYKVTKKLLQLGSNLKHISIFNRDSAASYWDLEKVIYNPIAATKILTLLCENGLKIDQYYNYQGHNIILYAHSYRIKELIDVYTMYGYQYDSRIITKCQNELETSIMLHEIYNF